MDQHSSARSHRYAHTSFALPLPPQSASALSASRFRFGGTLAIVFCSIPSLGDLHGYSSTGETVDLDAFVVASCANGTSGVTLASGTAESGLGGVWEIRLDLVWGLDAGFSVSFDAGFDAGLASGLVWL